MQTNIGLINNPNHNKRNVGIDILKIFSMLQIITLHVIQHYGVEEAINFFSVQSYSIKLILTFSCCAVNCYAMTTGYLMSNKEIKWSRLISLWFQIEFYSLGILLLFYFLGFMNIIPYKPIGFEQCLSSIFPILRGSWWYASCYFGLFFLIPYINKILMNSSKKQLSKTLFFIFLFLSVFSTITYSDGLGLKYGYSIIWLSIMYILGAYFKKYPIKGHWIWIFIYIGVNLLSWGGGLVADKLLIFPLFGEAKASNLLNLYISPTNILSSISLFLFFSNLKFKKIQPSLLNFITKLSGFTFGIYLIHSHDIIWEYFDNSLSFIASYSSYKMILLIFLSVLIIFTVSSLIELIRSIFFKFIKVDYLSDKIQNKINNYVDVLFMKIE